jgi:hypothetical protein
VEAIEGALAQDLEKIARFFYQNELVINRGIRKEKLRSCYLAQRRDFHYNHAIWK